MLAAGFPTPVITLRSGTGKRLGAVRTGGTLPDGTVSHTLMRADLHRALLDQVHARGIPVEYGTRLTALDRGDADALIGADGVHSTACSTPSTGRSARGRASSPPLPGAP